MSEQNGGDQLALSWPENWSMKFPAMVGKAILKSKCSFFMV